MASKSPCMAAAATAMGVAINIPYTATRMHSSTQPSQRRGVSILATLGLNVHLPFLSLTVLCMRLPARVCADGAGPSDARESSVRDGVGNRSQGPPVCEPRRKGHAGAARGARSGTWSYIHANQGRGEAPPPFICCGHRRDLSSFNWRGHNIMAAMKLRFPFINAAIGEVVRYGVRRPMQPYLDPTQFDDWRGHTNSRALSRRHPFPRSRAVFFDLRDVQCVHASSNVPSYLHEMLTGRLCVYAQRA